MPGTDSGNGRIVVLNYQTGGDAQTLKSKESSNQIIAIDSTDQNQVGSQSKITRHNTTDADVI
ncbi:hypothetical protein L1994_00330 [Methanomicrobium antiquum]|uniref:Uncharacterized protein n=1 Tax=Methanomicrobium antiquum TaxID=487686 RepID=A0AAF0JMT1_9EURY|nr:hypothetical protein [Methanomicrobium antiquum]MDD3976757.1 hypothetical protein [Methanomicrobium sp.]WFN36880.1 hypothetical protein L1994_00330 [Methanomicrobium antiquum]